ncbi:unnamed protein product [Cyberlindnera jadinii]|uniref:DUF8032 domain-containing protein n=1 Tax=Cyberlindnera jadinii (strain ATCC 18201 / CBS 1600 / BCRC 20928 / JCM 3617 / NBRC 0987 / NRRL Y-1542) TaxID=983966 RepID=A0A0H5C0C3_CYBJN|nr:hypothetical protein CYBJADRAFT_165826 [Cyberlindnera jadinii NRRL Y-1542]ODV76566.1 hypothetical protein CYBJADRAFT_165826 [Cyberlindnera jadinii NRRL Y-1542]CEP21183.1 unnamed protein product [Cyberlindnera jadinii]
MNLQYLEQNYMEYLTQTDKDVHQRVLQQWEFLPASSDDILSYSPLDTNYSGPSPNFSTLQEFQSDDFVPIETSQQFQNFSLSMSPLGSQAQPQAIPLSSTMTSVPACSSIPSPLSMLPTQQSPEFSSLTMPQDAQRKSSLLDELQHTTTALESHKGKLKAHRMKTKGRCSKSRTRSAPSMTDLPTQRGPIPASKPVLKVNPVTGEEVLSFSYSRKKIVTTFEIKCPIEPMNSNNFPTEFLVDNCVYPRAMAPPHVYTGKRGKYEHECNTIGWTLAWMNPKLRKHRGLIQRAVDSWRNTRRDTSLHSRKVRREESLIRNSGQQ